MHEKSHPTLAYRPDIDGLRAIAVSSVVLYHAFPSYLPGGFAGVDVFFVISGFLISSIIFKGLANGSFSLRVFYERRVRRIFPSLLLVLISSVLFGWFVLSPDAYSRLGKHTAGGASFVANFLLWNEAGYFDVSAHRKPLLHLWSLGIEEQFYLIWPVFALSVWRWLPRQRGSALVLLLLASFALNILLKDHNPEAAFYLPLTRFWELLVGALLAFHGQVRKPSFLARRASPVLLSVVGLGLLLAAFTLIDNRKSFPGWWAVMPVIGTATIILAGTRSSVNLRALASRPLVFVGLISYPLYLWHWPLLSYAHIIEGGTPDTSIRLGAVGLAILLAWGSWRFIETPIRESSGGQYFGALLGFGSLVAALGLALFLNDGVPRRMAAYTEQLAALRWTPESIRSPSCRRRFDALGLSYCLETRAGAEHDIALIGDSFANQYFKGFSARFEAMGKSLINLGRGQCPVLRGIETTHAVSYSCEALSNYILDYVTRTPSVQTVILANRWRRDVQGNIKSTRSPAEKNPAKILQAGIEDTVSELLAAGKRVIIVSGSPELPYHARSCIRFRPFYLSNRENKDRCAMPRRGYEKYSRAYKQVLADVMTKFPSVTMVDPAVPLCDADWCYGRMGGKLIYRDANHFSRAGAEWISDYLIREMSLAEDSAVLEASPMPVLPVGEGAE